MAEWAVSKWAVNTFADLPPDAQLLDYRWVSDEDRTYRKDADGWHPVVSVLETDGQRAQWDDRSARDPNNLSGTTWVSLYLDGVIPQKGSLWVWAPQHPHAREIVRVLDIKWKGRRADEIWVESEDVVHGRRCTNSLDVWCQMAVFDTPADEAPQRVTIRRTWWQMLTRR